MNQVNTLLQSIVSILKVGAAVVDRDLRIELWNSVAQELWGVREDEVLGRPFDALDIGLPVEEVSTAVRKGFLEGDGQYEFQVDAVNRRGRAFACKLTLLPSRLVGDDGWKMIVLMEAATHDGDGA